MSYHCAALTFLSLVVDVIWVKIKRGCLSLIRYTKVDIKYTIDKLAPKRL